MSPAAAALTPCAGGELAPSTFAVDEGIEPVVDALPPHADGRLRPVARWRGDVTVSSAAGLRTIGAGAEREHSSDPGEWVVTATATDDQGQVDSDSVTVAVVQAAADELVVTITAPADGGSTPGNRVTPSGQVQDGDGSSAGPHHPLAPQDPLLSGTPAGCGQAPRR